MGAGRFTDDFGKSGGRCHLLTRIRGSCCQPTSSVVTVHVTSAFETRAAGYAGGCTQLKSFVREPPTPEIDQFVRLELRELAGAGRLPEQVNLRNNRRLQAVMRSSPLPSVKTPEPLRLSFQPSIKREESLPGLGVLRSFQLMSRRHEASPVLTSKQDVELWGNGWVMTRWPLHSSIGYCTHGYLLNIRDNSCFDARTYASIAASIG